MKSNESAFHWLTPESGNAERRDYPMRGESIILSMTDLILYPPYASDHSHIHNCMEIGVCMEGGGVITMEGQHPHTFEEGTVIIVPEGAYHSQQNKNAPMVRWRYIAVDQKRLLEEAMPSCRSLLEKLLKRNEKGIYLVDEGMRSDVEWLIGRMFDIKCKAAEEATAELEAILQVILIRVSRDDGGEKEQHETVHPAKNPVEPALLYIAEQYHNEIKVAQLARSCAMSESHFRKVFAMYMGIAPTDYLNQYRIERAVHMIRTRQDMPVSRIAEACGYSSIATFNRNFIRYTGHKPTEIKNKKTKIHVNDE